VVVPEGQMLMSTLAIIVFAVGAILARRFGVLVLAPMILIGAGATAAVGIMRGDGALAIVPTCILVIVSLQLGYLSGAIVASSAPHRVLHHKRRA
jgi:hypothetical protein